MNLYNVAVELSGFGHYGIKSVIHQETFLKAIEAVQSRNDVAGWEDPRPEGNVHTCFGFNNSLRVWPSESSPELLDIFWLPEYIGDAMRSHTLLTELCWYVANQEGNTYTYSSDIVANDELVAEIEARARSPWAVRANFGPDIWDVIEGPLFERVVPDINADIRSWWQDSENYAAPGQYVTVFDGTYGRTIDIHYPGYNGISMSGTRNGDGLATHQLIDDHTTSIRDTLAHIFFLCTVQKYCREIRSSSQ